MIEIKKVLTKVSKEKHCEVIGKWKKACVRHFYWAVTSTQPKLGDVILAKLKAFLSHIILYYYITSIRISRTNYSTSVPTQLSLEPHVYG